MATAATALLGLALPVTGELSGTWGDAVNNSLTALLDTAVSGTTTLSSDADVTLTTTTLAANQARQAIILWTAGGSVTRNITAPAQSKPYIVINKTSSTQSIVLRGAGPTTGVTIVAGTAALVAWNGVDFVAVSVMVTISNDTATASNLFPLFANTTSGTASSLFTSNAQYLYKPSTGELQARGITAINGLVFNANTLVASTTVATGYNASSVGPFTVPSGLTVTVSSGSRWVVI